MLKLTKINKKYNDVIVLSDVNLEVQEGQWVMIIGESGCGKSTLLKIISRENDFDGTVEITDKIAIVQQEDDLINECTTYENIILNSSMNEEEINELLLKFDLLEVKDSLVSLLSGGEKQRVSIARAIAQKTKYILLDEPTAHQDDKNTIKIMNELQKCNQYSTIIMVTHDLDLCEFSDRVIEVKNGKLIELSSNKKNEIKEYKYKRKNQFKSNLFLLKNFKINFSTFVNIVISIAMCIGILFTSLNIGKDFSTSIMEQIDDSLASKQMFVYFEKPITEDELDSLLNGLDIHQVNYGYEFINTLNGITINNKKLEAIYDEESTILEKDVKFAISNSIANNLSIKKGDKINVKLNLIDNTLYKSGYRFGGMAPIYIPIFKDIEFEIIVDEIVQTNDDRVFFTRDILREIKNKSAMKESLKITDFSIVFENSKSFDNAKIKFSNELDATIKTIEEDIIKTETILKSQFSPFKYIAVFLSFILIVAFTMLHKNLEKIKKRQIKILKQINVSNFSICRLYLKQNFVLLFFTACVSISIYNFVGKLINTLFNPIDYTSFDQNVLNFLNSVDHQMINLSNVNHTINIFVIISLIYFGLSLIDIKLIYKKNYND